VPMHYLAEAEWKQRFEAAGFKDVTVRRVNDSRALDESSFEPDSCHPDLASKQAAHAAGSLWIHGVK